MNKKILILVVVAAVFWTIFVLFFIDNFFGPELTKEVSLSLVRKFSKDADSAASSAFSFEPVSVLREALPAGEISLGIYEACADIEDCDIKQGIEKIKKSGADSIIVTVVDEDENESVSYYPSRYLPMAAYAQDDYLTQIIRLAHQEGIKVYASINIPHNFWLKDHPDWIAVWSNGARGDFYEDDYFHRTVPPSRITSEPECLELLEDIIKEVIALGVDGIDINDNFQFSDQYLEEGDETLFSSFDDFTIEKFTKDTGLAVPGGSASQKAGYIESQVYSAWLAWRADQVTQFFKQIKKALPGIVLRPHLLTFGDPYEYYGLDYQSLAKEVDVVYMMFMPEQAKEKYFELAKKSLDSQAKKLAASTYLFVELDSSVIEKNPEKIFERMAWMKAAGFQEIYVYNFKLIDENNFWPAIKEMFDRIKK